MGRSSSIAAGGADSGKAAEHASYTRGQVAELSGTTAEAVRFYEREGLLSAPERSAGNYRLYSEVHLRELRFIAGMRELGFELSLSKAVLEASRREAVLAPRQLLEMSTALKSKQRLLSRLRALFKTQPHAEDLPSKLVQTISGK